MKTTRVLLLPLIVAAMTAVPGRSPAANTDGTVTFSTTTQDYNGNFAPDNIAVVWVVDSNGAFVKTLCRHANARINYLAQWVASRGAYTNVDGVTSATLSSQPQTHAVTWNCRGTNGQVVADGTYTFRAEYTSDNGQGAYLANVCTFVKGTAAVATNYPNYGDAVGQFTGMTLAYTPAADIGVTALAPGIGIVNSNVALQVTVTNLTLNPATFTVAVSNVTGGTLVGVQGVTALAGRAVTNLVFNWNTAGLVPGEYAIRAAAAGLANETVTANNARTGTIFLSSATAGDLAVTAIAPPDAVVGAVVPVTVTVANRMPDASGPFTVSLTNLPSLTVTEYSNAWRVAASADDAEENAATHEVSISSSDLELAFDATNQIVGIRFRNVGIPANVTITAASLQFTGRTNDTLNRNPIALTIRGQAADNAAVFTATASGISSRPDTAAAVAWAPANWANGETGPNARTPDLKTVVQEIVGRPGWTASNAVVFKITGSGGRRAWSYNGNTNAAPLLTVRWSTAAPAVTSVQIPNLPGLSATNVVFAWNTAGGTVGVYQASALAGPLVSETHTSDNGLTAGITLREALHDLAVSAIAIAPVVPPNVITNVIVTVTNAGDAGESSTLTVRDVTAAPILIGTYAVSNLAAGARTNVVCPWNTATNGAFALGYHTLRADVAPVPGETSTADNTNELQLIVAVGMTTNVLVSTNAVWRFMDQGLDLAAAPWPSSDYYDGFWSAGVAPLGYGLPGIATAIGYGGVASNRQVTAYFRREFTMDFPPTQFAARVLRAHGLVLYLNGAEIGRQNMPPEPVGYATLASNTVPDAAATNYVAFAVPPGTLRVGRNLLAAELHLAAVTNTTAGFALELTSVNPTIPRTPAVAVTALTPDGPVQSGDRLGVTIRLFNTGNAATACQVLLRDATTGAVLASQTVNTLVPGESAIVRLAWSTFGAATGSRTVQALTVIDGITNLTEFASAPVVLEAPDFAARAVPAAGSIGGRCNAVAVHGRYVYLGCGATLEIWDAAIPAAPVRCGAVRLPGIIEDVAAGSNWVYTANGAAGVQIVDVAAATQPVHRASFDSSGFSRQVALDGNFLYVADGLGGVRVLNVAAPAAPVLAGAYHTAGPAQTVALAGSTAIVLDSYSGLQVLTADDPAALAVTGVYSRLTAGLAATAVGDAVLAADANGGLFRLDTTVPALPTVVTNRLLPAAGRGLATAGAGAVLYVAAGAAGVLTLDAATLAAGTTTAVGGEASDLAVAGDLLYVAAGFAGCRALDISAPLAPLPLATLATGARPVDAQMSGPTLFVAADEAGLQIHSLTNLARPDWVTTVALATNPRCVTVSGAYAYVAEALGGVKIFDVTVPAAPTLVGSAPGAGLATIRRLAIAGPRLAMTDGRQVNLLDVSNPTLPVQLATNVLPGFVFDLAATTANVFAACGGAGLRILSNADLGLVGTFSTAPDPVVTVSVNGNYAYVGDGRAAVRILSITNPAAPTLVQATAGPGFGIASAGSLVYLVDGRNQGAVVNMSDPLTPVPSLNVTNLTLGLRVRAQGGVVLTAEDEAGLAIFNASPGDINLNGIPDSADQQVADASTTDALHSIWDVLPGDDFDQDGLSNLAESLAGTSLVDPASVFAVSAVNAQPEAGSGQFVIRWFSMAGKTYTLHKSTDLALGFTPLQSGIAATAPVNSYTDTVSTATAFYMISVP